MRIPKSISPSALKIFEKDREEYFLKYLAEDRLPRIKQFNYMAAGSAFDAFVKSFIYYRLYGNYGKDNQYERQSIFESQVEPQNRDEAAVVGQYIFEKYSRCGALADMMLALKTASNEPRFEFSVEGLIDSEVGNIPLLGKPDIFFINNQGARVVWDWKVNAFYSNSGASPFKGYTNVRDTWSSLDAKASRNNGCAHKDCVLEDHHGIKVNKAQYMEDCNPEWADQLSIYAWLLGEEIGSEQLIIGIDQIVSNGKRNKQGMPFLRVANFRSRISADYQFRLVGRLSYMWNCIKSGHLFTGLTRKDNDAKIADLDSKAKALSATDDFSKFINQVSRG